MSAGPTDHRATARQGRAAAARGDHRRALERYRAAIAAARSEGVPLIVLRHYSDCVLESLELLGEHQAVLAYCDAAIAWYQTTPPRTVLGVRDLADLHQRRGAVLAKEGDYAAGQAALSEAIATAATVGADAPLATLLVDWLRRRLAPPMDRILSAQRRHGYFAAGQAELPTPG